MQKIYQDIAGSATFKQAGIELPSSSYLLCSRRAALFAGLRKPEYLLPFLEKHFSGTLRYFFEKRLYVSDENMHAIEKTIGSSTLNKVVSLPEDYELIRKSLLAVFEILAVQAGRERDALLSYCKAQGMEAGGKIGLVDIGYSCTIQKALMKLLEVPLNGYYFALENHTSKMDHAGSGARGYMGQLVNPAVNAVGILKYRLLFEAVLTAPENQLLNFAFGKDGATPVFKQAGLSQKQFDVVARIQDGIQAFVKDMLDLFGTDILKIELPVQELVFYYQMIATGRIDIGDLKETLTVEDEYCGNPEILVIDYYIDMAKRGNGLEGE